MWPNHKHGKHDDIGADPFQVRRKDIKKWFGDADQDAAKNSAGDGAKTPDNRPGKSLEAEEAHLR